MLGFAGTVSAFGVAFMAPVVFLTSSDGSAFLTWMGVLLLLEFVAMCVVYKVEVRRRPQRHLWRVAYLPTLRQLFNRSEPRS
jgi:hypothetical protein